MLFNENENFGRLSQAPQLFGRSRLGFWMPLGCPFKNTSELKSAKNHGKSGFLVGRPLGFLLKLKLRAAITRVPHGVGGSQVGFWMPLGSLSIKAFSVKK